MPAYHCASNPEAVFSIVSNDDTVHHATAVWVQDDTVCFFTPEGSSGSCLEFLVTGSKGEKAVQATIASGVTQARSK